MLIGTGERIGLVTIGRRPLSTYNKDPREDGAVGFRNSLQQLTLLVRAASFFVNGGDLTAQVKHVLEEGLEVVLIGWFLGLRSTGNRGLKGVESLLEQSSLNGQSVIRGLRSE